MNQVIIGIDPDSKASGFAVYIDGQLVSISCQKLHDLFDALLTFDDPIVVIEDLISVSSNAFNISARDPMGVKLKKAEHVGRCKQVQYLITEFCNEKCIKVINKPVSKSWKTSVHGKKQFELTTNWTGRSNEDSRSAAFFGWLGVQDLKNKGKQNAN